MTATVIVRDLRVVLTGTDVDIVDGVSFEISEGEILGLVGESGSGKTTVGTAMLAYSRSGARIAGGTVHVGGEEILSLGSRRLRALRGPHVSYVPQDPASALNPALRVGTQLREVLDAHGERQTDVDARVKEALRDVKLPDDAQMLSRFPHQLSGGQQQRVCIAMAFLLRPRLVVLDEPTTGLDVTTQAHVLQTVRDLARKHRAAALYVTHDLAVVSDIADRVMVMYAGRVAELGSRGEVFDTPAHPYTMRLLRAIPDITENRILEGVPGNAPAPGHRPSACEFAPRCHAAIAICHAETPPKVMLTDRHWARCHRAAESTPTEVSQSRMRDERPSGEDVLRVSNLSASYGSTPVLHDISFGLRKGECLALVGESGSGKTTLARSLIGLHTQWTGVAVIGETSLETAARNRSPRARQELQYIFQSPYNSLNPRKTVHQIVATPLRHFHRARGDEAERRVRDAIAQVALTNRVLDRYPDQLSGGERQRVAIARALVCDPRVLICDEVTSALDVSVQAAVVDVLHQLQRDRHLSIVFVTHDLALVRSIADRVVVLNRGLVVETGATDGLLDDPQHPYTQALLSNTPSLGIRSDGSHSSAVSGWRKPIVQP